MRARLQRWERAYGVPVVCVLLAVIGMVGRGADWAQDAETLLCLYLGFSTGRLIAEIRGREEARRLRAAIVREQLTNARLHRANQRIVARARRGSRTGTGSA